jgi:hypothetical protein
MKNQIVPAVSLITIAICLAFVGVPRCRAASADLAMTSFSGFSPQPILPGAHPTSLSFQIVNYGPASVGNPSVGSPGHVLLDLYLSSNATFGDGDDMNIGEMNLTALLPAGGTADITVSNPNGLTGFVVPAGISGQYHAFLQVKHTATSGLTDPDPSDNVAMLPTTLSFGSDVTPPTVVSVARLNPTGQLTSASSVVYRVTFSEHVTNVDVADFLLTDVSNTIDGESITSASATSGTTIDVTVNTGSSGSGDLRLDIVYPGATISDDAGNLLTSSFTTGQTYSIDKTPPTILSILEPAPNPRTSAVTNLDVIFSEPISLSTFTYDDLALQRDGYAVSLTSAVLVNLLSGTTYRISNLDGFTAAPGAYVLTVNASSIQDLAGNGGIGSSSAAWSLARPALALTVSNNISLLSWPTWAEGYELETAAALSPPVVWISVTNAPVISGGQKTVALSISGTGAFFRLNRR